MPSESPSSATSESPGSRFLGIVAHTQTAFRSVMESSIQATDVPWEQLLATIRGMLAEAGWALDPQKPQSYRHPNYGRIAGRGLDHDCLSESPLDTFTLVLPDAGGSIVRLWGRITYTNTKLFGVRQYVFRISPTPAASYENPPL